jgi:hypothetical protein
MVERRRKENEEILKYAKNSEKGVGSQVLNLH